MSFLIEDQLAPETKERLLTKPFEHILIDSDPKAKSFGSEGPIVWDSFGCPEDDKLERITQVGKLAQDIEAEDESAKFYLLLGDNNTPKGVIDKNDPKFQTNFHNVHSKVTFCILGNHDVHITKEVKKPNEDPLKDEASLAQILHTFVDPATGKWDTHKIKCWENTEVDLAELRKSKNNWNIPGRYGVLHCGREKKHTDFFVIDSSRFVADFINYFVLKTDKDENNQAVWLLRAVRASTAQHKILLSHHPLHDMGKRNVISDHLDYLTPAQVEALAKFGIKGNYNEMLKQIMFYSPDELPAPGKLLTEAQTAHHHAINFSKGVSAVSPKPAQETKEHPKAMTQWVSGGAGGPNQKRHVFCKNDVFNTTDSGYVQHFTNTNGDSGGFVHTLRGTHVKIVNGKIVKKPRDEKTAKIENVLLETCQQFQAYLCKNSLCNLDPKLNLQPTYDFWGKGKKAFDWVPAFYRFSDDLQNFLNRYEPPPPEEIQAFLNEQLAKCYVSTKKQFDERVAYFKSHIARNYLPKIFSSPETAVLNTSGEYFRILNEQHKKWKELIGLSLKELQPFFTVSFEKYFKHISDTPVKEQNLIMEPATGFGSYVNSFMTFITPTRTPTPPSATDKSPEQASPNPKSEMSLSGIELTITCGVEAMSKKTSAEPEKSLSSASVRM